MGAVAEYAHSLDGLDVITRITAADSLEEWLGSWVNKTYKAGMYAADIIDDLLNIFGVEVSLVKLAVNKLYPRLPCLPRQAEGCAHQHRLQRTAGPAW